MLADGSSKELTLMTQAPPQVPPLRFLLSQQVKAPRQHPLPLPVAQIYQCKTSRNSFSDSSGLSKRA